MKKITIMASMFYLSINASFVYSEGYDISRISHVHTNTSGRILIKWDGAPNPGPCGSPNHGWVVIESTSDNALKSFTYMLYAAGKKAVVTTSGCVGNYEIVTGIYSPGG